MGMLGCQESFDTCSANVEEASYLNDEIGCSVEIPKISISNLSDQSGRTFSIYGHRRPVSTNEIIRTSRPGVDF